MAPTLKENAVLGDLDLQAALKGIDPAWGDFCTRAAGEVWGMPLIDQKTKSFLTLAIDVVNSGTEPAPFFAHLDMAMKQGATEAEIHELLMFMSVYAGFNKVAPAMQHFKEFVAAQKK
jgi:4-carboxymuconolactone decarboxylase